MSPMAEVMRPEVEGRPYGTQIRVLAETYPDTVAVTVVDEAGGPTRLDWRTLDRRSNQVGRAFAGEGVGVGDRVGLELPNSVEMVEAVLACWKIGASPVPVRWDLPDWERARVAGVLDAALLVGRDRVELFERSRSLSDEALPEVVAPAVNGICSSGSTGTPKIIMDHSPAVMTPSRTAPFPANWGVDVGRQIILVPTALYHTNGFAQFVYLLAGDSLVIMTKFDAALALDLIERERITAFTATPTMLARMARVPGVEQRDLSSVVWVQQGAAVFPPALARFWIDLLGGERLYMCYGMTERLGPHRHPGRRVARPPRQHRTGLSRHRAAHPRRAPARRADRRGGRDLPALGLDRSLRLSREPPTRLPMTEDGFATAGDLGRLDEEGYCYIADRRVDMIVTGGANVFPAEVEAALSEHRGGGRRGGGRAPRPRVGPAGARHHRAPRSRRAADCRRDPGLRQGTVGALQGAEDGGVRHRHPPQRGHQGEPGPAHRRTHGHRGGSIVAVRGQRRRMTTLALAPRPMVWARPTRAPST